MALLSYTDDFNAAALNQPPPSPWVAQPGTGGAVDVVGDPAAGAPHGRVVRIFDNDTGSRSVLRLDYAAAGLGAWNTNPMRNDLTVEFYVRAAQANRQLIIGCRESISGTPGGDRRIVSMRSDGTFGFHSDLGFDSSTSISGTTYVADTWYKILFVYDRVDRAVWSNNNLVAFWMDDVKKGTTHNAGSNAGNVFDQLVFWTNPGEGAATFYVDDVKIGGAYSAIAGPNSIVRKEDGDPAAGARAHFVRQSNGTSFGSGVANASGTSFASGVVIATESFDPVKVSVILFGAAPGDGASVRPDVPVI